MRQNASPITLFEELALPSPPILETETASGPVTEAEPKPERVLRCSRCSHAITREEARVVRAGSHVHTRINPHGFVHEFGCFAEAEGCRTFGEATTFFTWFPGHAWRMAECGSCGVHLGWRFEGASGSFFGLLFERLV
ncbi:hypothetical protein HY251_07205 [bacterium]|nr:hypothetical protein [bacterium]